MYRDMRVAVVVPAHNEELLVGTVIATAPDLVDHVIVVDDASTDGTFQAAKSVDDPRLEVLSLPENQGVGGAIVTGHKRALELGCDVAVVMAGDAQMDPAYLPALLDPIADGEAQFTKANRFYGEGSFEGMPRHRVVGNIGMSFLTKAASGYWGLFDPQNGYTAIHRTALERLQLDRLAKRYEFENDLLIKLNVLRVPARDVPIPAVYGTEVSGLKVGRVAPRLLSMLWRGFWHRMWWKYVLQSFSAVALMFFTGLFLVAIGTRVQRLHRRQHPGSARRQPRHRPPRGRSPAQRSALPGLGDAARHPGRQSMSQQVEVDQGAPAEPGHRALHGLARAIPAPRSVRAVRDLGPRGPSVRRDRRARPRLPGRGCGPWAVGHRPRERHPWHRGLARGALGHRRRRPPGVPGPQVHQGP